MKIIKYTLVLFWFAIILQNCYFDNTPPSEIIRDNTYINIDVTGLTPNTKIIFLIEYKGGGETKQIYKNFDSNLYADSNGSFIARFFLARNVLPSDSKVLFLVDENNNGVIEVGENGYYAIATSRSDYELLIQANFTSFKSLIGQNVVGPLSGNPQYCVYLSNAFDVNFTASFSPATKWLSFLQWSSGEGGTNKNIVVHPDVATVSSKCGFPN